MTVLNDQSIDNAVFTGELGITPYRKSQLQAASYDFRLSNRFLEVSPSWKDFVTKEDEYGNPILHLADALELIDTKLVVAQNYVLSPGDCVLGISQESFRFSNRICGKVSCKSTIGRAFVTITSDAGFFDPGFNGYAVIEIVNHRPDMAIELLAGMKIGQMTFFRLEHPAERIYQGNYQEQTDFAEERWKQALKKLSQNIEE